MRIKWIELNGFKSFPDRTKIEINEGITCFVGPNGAGKSNIVDAFRWILGEHNPRILRGEKMEEVIFQGSGSKKEKGLAEVSMLLHIEEESQNGNTPQSREIEIKRRFYRTGESYFIINGKQSRLKDIKEIFLSEGVDVRTYSIIDQLKINEVLSKPSHRKSLLEECAGIASYKMKKTESEVKLGSAKENLQRIEDILGELKKQYSLLERQAKRAEKYKKILNEMTDLELKVSKAESTWLLNELERLKEELKSLENKQQALKKENTTLNIKMEEQKLKINDIENHIQEKEKENKQKEYEKAKAEKELALLSQEEKNKAEAIEKLREENSFLSNEIERLQRELKENATSVQEIEKKIKEIQNEIIIYEENLLEFQRKTGEIEKTIEKERKFLFNLTTELANKKNFYNSSKKTLENNQNKINALIFKKQEIIQKIENMERESLDNELKIKNLRNSLQTEKAQLKELDNKIFLLDNSVDDKNKKIIEKKKQEAVINGKIEALASEIWSEDKENKLFFECIDVSPEVENLIETYFDEKLKASVIEDINQIKSSDKRKFFYLKNLPKDIHTKTVAYELTGIKEFIKIKESLNFDIIENAFIVEDLKEALEQKRKLPNSIFITKKGEVLYPDGFIKIGKSSELLKKKRTLEELKEEREKINKEIETLEKELSENKKEREKLRDTIEKKKKLINNLNNELFRSEENHKSMLREIEAMKQRLKFMEKEEKALQQEIDETKKTIENLKVEIEHLSFQIEETEAKIEELKQEQTNAFKENEDKKESLSTKKIELSTLKERLNSKNGERDRLNENMKRLMSKKNRNEVEIEENLRKINQIKIEYTEKLNKLEITTKEIENFKNEVEKLFKNLQEGRIIIDKLEREYYQINEELQNITVLIGDKKAKESELKIKLENLWNEIYNLYGKDILKDQIEPIENYDLAKGKISQLKAQLKDIGYVDIEILREYEEVKERYDFMLNQQKDIKTSIEELEEAIKKINTLTRKKLRDTSELLKEKFNSLFQELFGGGKAEIFLTDESNILESELEINVQPPGKKMSSLNLLSGGEKTLTAIAFMFACLSIRPSPVCILDEVDAPLDDPNTLRFRNLIKNLSDRTQFLIITHNKLMMEAANYIYGVTMQEEGVSTVISLELKEAEDYA